MMTLWLLSTPTLRSPAHLTYHALRAGLSRVLRAALPERRSEVRVRLRVMLKLRGTDSSNKPFEEVSATENVSLSGFHCGCTAVLKKDSTVQVYMVSGGPQLIGTARVLRRDECDTRYPRYAFRFVEKQGQWVLQ